MTRWANVAPLLCLALFLAGCQERRSSEMRYKIGLTSDGSSGRQTRYTVVSVTARQNYNFNFGGNGWGGLGCRVDGSAIVIPAIDGTLLALPTSKGASVEDQQCNIIQARLGVPYADPTGGWVDTWRALARSTKRIAVPIDELVTLVFVPAGEDFGSARMVDPAAAYQFGIKVSDGFVEVTQEPVPPVADQVVRLAALSDERARKLPFETFSIWRTLTSESGTGR